MSNGTGFMGVQQLLQQEPSQKSGKTFHFKKRKHKWEEEEKYHLVVLIVVQSVVDPVLS